MRKKIFILIVFMVCLLLISPANGFGAKDHTVTVAMCRPSKGQIKNIVVLKNREIIDIKNLKLLCVYHEDELTDYRDAVFYVKKNNLFWVDFIKIKGRVKLNGIFKKNIWTSQFKAVFDNSDGIIFTGGMDIPPALYGEENSLLTVATTPIRTYYETSFLFHLIGGEKNRSFVPFLEEKNRYPVLGICLGAQTMNVSAGGTLIQDIPSEIYGYKSVEQVLKSNGDSIHSSLYMKLMNPENNKNIAPAFHKIEYTKESVLLRLFFKKNSELPTVLSSHHQSVKKPGYNLIVAARSLDGKVVEALEHRKYKNVLGVQFHPEFNLLYDGIKLFTNDPSKHEYYVLKDFVKKNMSMAYFHKKLWGWFASSLKQVSEINSR